MNSSSSAGGGANGNGNANGGENVPLPLAAIDYAIDRHNSVLYIAQTSADLHNRQIAAVCDLLQEPYEEAVKKHNANRE